MQTYEIIQKVCNSNGVSTFFVTNRYENFKGQADFKPILKFFIDY